MTRLPLYTYAEESSRPILRHLTRRNDFVVGYICVSLTEQPSDL